MWCRGGVKSTAEAAVSSEVLSYCLWRLLFRFGETNVFIFQTTTEQELSVQLLLYPPSKTVFLCFC